jgi:hypothetical protein
MAINATTDEILARENAKLAAKGLKPMTNKEVAGVGTVTTNWDISPQEAESLARTYADYEEARQCQ